MVYPDGQFMMHQTPLLKKSRRHFSTSQTQKVDTNRTTRNIQSSRNSETGQHNSYGVRELEALKLTKHTSNALSSIQRRSSSLERVYTMGHSFTIVYPPMSECVRLQPAQQTIVVTRGQSVPTISKTNTAISVGTRRVTQQKRANDRNFAQNWAC